MTPDDNPFTRYSHLWFMFEAERHYGQGFVMRLLIGCLIAALVLAGWLQ